MYPDSLDTCGSFCILPDQTAASVSHSLMVFTSNSMISATSSIECPFFINFKAVDLACSSRPSTKLSCYDMPYYILNGII